MKLNEEDLKTITASLVVSYMNDDERSNFRKQCRELHDRIQEVRKKNGTFVSVEDKE